MKKLLFIFALLLSVTFNSCGNSTATIEQSDFMTTDSIVIDSIDTLVIDTLVEDTM